MRDVGVEKDVISIDRSFRSRKRHYAVKIAL